MKRLILLLLLAAVLVLAFFLHRSRTAPDRLDVDPNAALEIEKAKRR